MVEKYLKLAKKAAVEAGDFLIGRVDIQVDKSLGRDLKLSSDKESERLIIDCLSASNLPILSEECGLIGESDGLRWIVDPLDGTVNYFRGIDDFCCVSIALFNNNEPVLGVVNRFKCNELYAGIVGQSADINGRPIEVSKVTKMEDAVLCTGYPAEMDFSEENLKNYIRRVRRAKKTRMLGSATLMATFVACGKTDIYFEKDIMLWDVAGAMAIVKAAGGVVQLESSSSDYKCDFGAFSSKALMEEFYGF